MRSKFYLFVFCLALLPIGAFAETYSLEALLQLAKSRSETVGSKAELVRQAEARFWQSIGAVLPTIKGTGSYTWQDELKNSTVSSGNQSQMRISGTQPIFKGLREYFGIAQARSLIHASRQSKRAEVLRVYEAVAQSFFQILSLKKEQENLKAQIDAFRKRIQDLQSRIRVGRSRKSEVLAVQVTLETLLAQESNLKAQFDAEYLNLAFLTDLPLQAEFKDTTRVPALIPSSEELIANAKTHPRVAEKKFSYDAAADASYGAWGAHLPTVDASGNYYIRRPSPLKDVEWDVKIEMSIPLFEGGSTQQKIREAESSERQARLEFLRAQREVETSIRSQIEILKGSQLELAALDSASASADKNYSEQISQYELGLVSNLDVLAALNTRAEVRRSRDRADFMTRLNWVRLQLLAGLWKDLEL